MVERENKKSKKFWKACKKQKLIYTVTQAMGERESSKRIMQLSSFFLLLKSIICMIKRMQLIVGIRASMNNATVRLMFPRYM